MESTPPPPTAAGAEAAAEDVGDAVAEAERLRATASAKFVLLPSGQVATLACPIGMTISQIKEQFAKELRFHSSLLHVLFDGRLLSNDVTLASLGVGPNGTIQLELQSTDPGSHPLPAYKPRDANYVMPDVITVKVETTNGDIRDVVVEVEREVRRKRFIGGYRNKKTGIEYHHVAAQTLPKRPQDSGIEKFCRDTQTVDQKNQRQQTTEETSVQMTKIGVYVSNMQDRLMVPGAYMTADDYHAMLLSKIIILQKYWRRWLAQRRVARLRGERGVRLEWERNEELRKKQEKEDRIRRGFERRMNPKNKDDFDLLFHALEKWRLEELAVINATMTGAERKAELCRLLEQEAELIASIGRHKNDSDKENKILLIKKFLDKAANPKKWRGPDGKPTLMDTPYTIRARELKNIYNSINMKYLTQDERLDVLLTLKHTVKEHDCRLTQDIVELIDREADLLMRGVKEGNLEGLRKRISTLFLQYIKTPTFNPEAARLLKVPQDPSVLRSNIYFCPSCQRYLPSIEFPLASNSRLTGRCHGCLKIDNDGRNRQDFSHYRFMLKNLRKAEEAFNDNSRICYLVQESDIRFLVDRIWKSQSALSAWDDMYDLVLIRWDRTEEWSPWNTVLLTKDEASSHNRLSNIEDGYESTFLQRVYHQHTVAKNYFIRLPAMSDYLKTKTATKKITMEVQGHHVTA